jgi:outer membrane protein assembly factor BamD (BamD/ComL family)
MKKLSVLLLLLLIGCSSHVKKNASSHYTENLYKEAKGLYDKGKFEEASKKLDGILAIKEKDTPYLAEALYLKSKIYITMAKQMKNPINYDPILGQFRDDKMAKTYDRLYSVSVYNLNTILSLFPKSEIAPTALFLYGTIYDSDHLNFFQEAILAYNLIVTHYPDSKERTAAEKRLNKLNEIMKGSDEATYDGLN